MAKNTEEKGLQIALSLKAESTVDTIRTLKGRVRELSQEFNLLEKAAEFDQSVGKFDTLVREMNILGDSLDEQERLVEKLKQRLNELDGQYKDYTARVVESQKALENYDAAADQDGKTLDELKKNHEAYGKAVLATLKNIGKVGDELTKESTKLEIVRGKYNESIKAFDSFDNAIASNVSSIDDVISFMKTWSRQNGEVYDSYQRVLNIDPSNLGVMHEQFAALGEEMKAQANIVDLSKQKITELTNKYGEKSTQVSAAINQYKLEENSLRLLQNRYGELYDAIYRQSDARVKTVKANESVISSNGKVITNNEKLIKSLDKLAKIDPKNITTFQSKVSLLGEELEAQKSSVDKCKKNIELLSDVYGESSEQVKDARQELKEMEIELQILQARYDSSVDDVKNFGNATEQASESVEKSTEKITTLTVSIGSLISKGIQVGINSYKKLADAVRDTGKEFENGLNGLAAILHVANDDAGIVELGEDFMKLAEKSKYSAEEFAENAKVLANAGYDNKQIQDSIKHISDLAAGTGEEFDTMATVVVDGLAAFKMSASQSQYFADVLAKAATSSNTDVTQLGQAFGYAGAVAGTFNYDVRDVAQALGIMATQGIKGTTAGTALRQIITRIAANTSKAGDAAKELGVAFYDETGKANSLIDVLEGLRKGLGNLNDEQKAEYEYTIAGQRGLTALSAIVNASEQDWNDLKDSISEYNGTVEEMSNTRLDSYIGDATTLQNTWKNVAIEMFNDVSPSLRDVYGNLKNIMKSDVFKKNVSGLVRDINKGLSTANRLIISLSKSSISLTGTTKAMLSLGIVTKSAKVIQSLAVFATRFKNVKSAAELFAVALGGLNPIALGVSAGIAGVTYALAKQSAEFDRTHPLYQKFESDHLELVNSMEDTRNAFDRSAEAALTEYDASQTLIGRLKDLVDENGNVKQGYEERVNFILGELRNAYGVEADIVDGRIQNYDDFLKKLQEVSEQEAITALVAAASEKVTQATVNQSQAVQQQRDAYALLSQEIGEAIGELNGLTGSDYDEWWYIYAGNIAKTKEEWDNLTDSEKANVLMQTDLAFAHNETVTAIAEANKAVADANAELEKSNAELLAAESGDIQAFADMVAKNNSDVTGSYSGTIQELNAFALQYKALSESMKTASDEEKLKIADDMLAIQESYKKLYEELGKPEEAIKLEVDVAAVRVSATNAATAYDEALKIQAARDSLRREEDWRKFGKNETVAYEGGAEAGIKTGRGPLVLASEDASSAGIKPFLDKFTYVNGNTDGYEYVRGLANGVLSGTGLLTTASREISQIPSNTFRSENRISSPSKRAMDDSKWLPAGWAKGITNNLDMLKGAAGRAVSTINDTFTSGFDSANSVNTETIAYRNSIASAAGVSNASIVEAISASNRNMINLLSSYLPQMASDLNGGKVIEMDGRELGRTLKEMGVKF